MYSICYTPLYSLSITPSLVGGAAGSAAGEAAIPAMVQYLKDQGLQENSPLFATLMQAGSATIGAAVGSGSGAAAGLAGERYNRELPPDEIAKLNALKQGKSPEEQQRLTDAACALTHCSAGVPDSDPNKAILVASEQRGQVDLDEQNLLKGTGLYNYDHWDGLSDWSRSNELGARALGGLQWVGGSAQALGGAATASTCTTGVGCLAAGYLFTSGVDNAQAGFQSLINGAATSTWGAQVLQGFGLSPQTAELVYGATQFVGPAAGAYLANKTVDELTAANAAARMSYTTEPFNPKGVQVTSEVMQSPQAQAIVNSYVASGLSLARAEDIAAELINSGSSLPTEMAVTPTELIKMVPKGIFSGDQVGGYSPYFMTRGEFNRVSQLPPDQIANQLGFPA